MMTSKFSSTPAQAVTLTLLSIFLLSACAGSAASSEPEAPPPMATGGEGVAGPAPEVEEAEVRAPISPEEIQRAEALLVGVWRADLSVLQNDPQIAANPLAAGLLSTMRIQWRFEETGRAVTQASVADSSASDEHRWSVGAASDGGAVELSLTPAEEGEEGTAHELDFVSTDRVEIANAVRFEDGWIDLSFDRVASRQAEAESATVAHIELLYGEWELDREATYDYLVDSVGENMAEAFTEITSTLHVDEEQLIFSLQLEGDDDSYPYVYEVESSQGATLTLVTRNDEGESARMRVRFVEDDTVVISDPESSEDISGAMVYVQMSEGGEPLPEAQ